MGFIVGDTANIASRMRKWEPVRFGPELHNATMDNVDNWVQYHQSEPVFFKNGKKVVPKKAIEKLLTKRGGGKLAIFALGLSLATTAIFGSKDKFGTIA